MFWYMSMLWNDPHNQANHHAYHITSLQLSGCKVWIQSLSSVYWSLLRQVHRENHNAEGFLALIVKLFVVLEGKSKQTETKSKNKTKQAKQTNKNPERKEEKREK